jgi:hypothetical protein
VVIKMEMLGMNPKSFAKSVALPQIGRAIDY